MINSVSFYYYSYLPVLFESLNSIQNTNNLWGTQLLYPAFFPQTSAINPVVANIVDLQQIENELQTSAENLLEALNKRTVEVDREGLNVTVRDNAPVGTYNMNILQLAQSQINEGLWLNATALDFQVGENTFKITTQNGEYTFTINVSDTSNNLAVLEDVAEAINQANIGIKATVEIENDTARLVLEGKTGEENAFTVEDITGNIVAASGISNTIQNAQNLIYEYNGTTYESETNTFEVEGMTLTAEQTGEYTITVNYDTEAILSSLEEFVNSFNKLVDFVEAYGAPVSVEGMMNVIRNNPMLQNLGISVENGRLVMNTNATLLDDPNYVKNVVEPAIESVAQSTENLTEFLRNIPTYQMLNYESYDFLNNENYGFNYFEYLKQLYEYNIVSTLISANLFNTYA